MDQYSPTPSPPSSATTPCPPHAANGPCQTPVAIVSVPSTSEFLSYPPSSCSSISTSVKPRPSTSVPPPPPPPSTVPPPSDEPMTMLACANGQVRRMRSVLDMRLGALVAAGMPLLEEGHVSPSRRLRTSSPSNESTLIGNGHAFTASSSSTQERIVDSPQSILSADDTAWLVAQIGQLKIEQTHDHDFDQLSTSHVTEAESFNGGNHVEGVKSVSCKQIDDEQDGQIDVFGIPIPSSSPCSSCVSLSTSFPRPSYLSKHNGDFEKLQRPFGVDDLAVSGNSQLDDLVQTTASHVSHSVSDPSCSVVLADSPSRLDLSALLC